jgi:Zn-dependent peptidase ImmA (M78 family)
MNLIKPRRLTFSYIRDLADKIRNQYLKPVDKIPVDIEKLIEIHLGLEIVSAINLKSETDIVGVLMSDLRTIYVDRTVYYEDKFSNLYRFTLAHELGHYFLHQEDIKALAFSNVQEWVDWRLAMDEEDLDWYEKQASEFAGRILVPIDPLKELFLSQENRIRDFLNGEERIDMEEMALEAVSRVLCSSFGVSMQVIETRLYKEGIWKEFLGKIASGL